MIRLITRALAVAAILAAPPPIVAQDYATQIEETLARMHQIGQFNGSVLVARGGEVIYEGGFGYAIMEWEVPAGVDTKHRIGSVTKQFTAVLVMQLVEDGLLSLDGTIVDYLPDYPRPQGERVTIHHLLNHTSGIPSYTALPGFMEDNVREPFAPDELVDVFDEMDLEFEPGSQFRYNNSGYFLLGAIIEEVTGKSYDRVLRERILDPLRLSDTGYDHEEEVRSQGAAGYVRTLGGYRNARYLDTSIPYAAGMMYSTVRDLHAWNQALYTDVLFDDPASMEKLLTPGLSDYAYGLVVRDVQIGDDGPTVHVVEHGGGIFGFSTAFRRFPNERNTVVVIDNTSQSAGAVAEAITRILYDQPVEPPRESIAERLLPIVERNGVAAGRQRYLSLQRDSPDDYRFGPGELQRLGLHFLEEGETDTAVELLEFSAEYYPDSPQPHWALGVALREDGDRDAAIEHLTEALRLDGDFEPARETLEEMGVEIDPSLAAGIDLDVAVLERYVGEYRIREDFTVTISLDAGTLFAQATGQSKFEITPRTETRFFLRGVAAQLEFQIGSDGRAESMTLFQGGRQTLATRIN